MSVVPVRSVGPSMPEVFCRSPHRLAATVVASLRADMPSPCGAAAGPVRPSWHAGLVRRHAGMASLAYGLAVPAGICLQHLAPAAVLPVAVGIAAAGVPHGALDHWAARRTFGGTMTSPIWWASFLAGYLLVAALVLLGWALAPLATLMGFLLISAWHFGEEDRDAAGWSGGDAVSGAACLILRGGLPIVLPAICHPGDTAIIFGWLTGDLEASQVLVGLLRYPVGGLWLAACVLELAQVWRRPHPVGGTGLLALSALAFVFLQPLLAFALYFALLHAPRHLLGVLSASREEAAGRAIRRLVRAAAPLTLAVFGFGLAAIATLVAAPAARLDVAAVQVLFWGLSALTVPHMLLEGLADRHGR